MMGYVFEDPDGVDVWLPNIITGKLFVEVARSLAESFAARTGLEQETGLEELASDQYRIHPQEFSQFVAKVVKQTWHNTSLRELERGFLASSVILIEKLGMTSEAEALERTLTLESPLSLEILRGAVTHST
jgi:hypothetical protein